MQILWISSDNYNIENQDTLTEILYGYSADGDFESDLDLNPITQDYEPVLTKPLLFYGILETINDGQKNINWINVDGDSNNHQIIFQYILDHLIQILLERQQYFQNIH